MALPERSLGGPTVTEFRAFVAVAQELHFGRAARRLGVAAPSLSQTLRRLEEKLGGVLLERTPRSVALTEAGADLLPRAVDILGRMDAARRAVSDLSHIAADTLTIGVVSNGFAEITAPILDAFRSAHPRVRLALRDVTTEDGNAVLRGTADVLLARPPVREQSDPRLFYEEVVAEPRCVLLPAGHRLAEAPVVGMSELLGESFVTVGPGLPEITDYWAAADHRDGEPVRMGADAWSVSDVLGAVAYLGDVTTSIPSVLRFFSFPGVVAVPMRGVGDAPMAVIAAAEGRRASVDAFIGTVRAVSDELVGLVAGARRVPSTAA